MSIRFASLALAAVAALPLAACNGDEPLAFDPSPAVQAHVAAAGAERHEALAELRHATARYHDLDAALADGFVLVHPCEDRPGEGPVGAVYALPGRLDGVIDTSEPEALIYEPAGHGRFTLVGVELVIPYAAWTEAEPPEFLGATFQREDELGVFGLHVWIWRNNPRGVFAPSNPRVSCDLAS